jgi:hypothetical protein
MRRFSISGLLAIVAVCAVGIAALRGGSDLWFRSTYTATLAALAVATLGAMLDTRPRGAWHGFALFGWGYYLAIFVPAIHDVIGAQFVALPFLDDLAERFQRSPVAPLNPPPDDVLQGFVDVTDPATATYARARLSYLESLQDSRKTARLFVCWLLAIAGSILGRVLAARRAPGEAPPHRAS